MFESALNIVGETFPDLPRTTQDDVVNELRAHCEDHLSRAYDSGKADDEEHRPRRPDGLSLGPDTLPGKLLQVIAMRENALNDRMNVAARAVLLATASGTDLDHVAARSGVLRMQIEPADDTASPPKKAVLESDERLRRRARLAVRSISDTGTEASYVFAAMSAHAQLKDVRVYVDADHRINVALLSIHGDGSGADDPGLMDHHEQIRLTVAKAMAQVGSVTDSFVVSWAHPEPYIVRAAIGLDMPTMQHDPGAADELRDRILDKVRAVVVKNHRLGRSVLREEFFAAIWQPGVASVNLSDPADRSFGLSAAPWLNPDDLRITRDDQRFWLTSVAEDDDEENGC